MATNLRGLQILEEPSPNERAILPNHSRSSPVPWPFQGLADALVTLHKSPGQHGANIRMNWFYMRAWRWMADATVYLILFISVSGIYLWYVLRAERSLGVILLFTGALSFFGMVYALVH